MEADYDVGKIMAKSDLMISGLTLRALVRAAETPVSGQLVKRQLFADLELDDVLKVDLRNEDPPLASMPVHPERED